MGYLRFDRHKNEEEHFLTYEAKKDESISDFDLRKALIENIMKLSKEQQDKTVEEAKRLGFFINEKNY